MKTPLQRKPRLDQATKDAMLLMYDEHPELQVEVIAKLFGSSRPTLHRLIQARAKAAKTRKRPETTIPVTV